MSNKIIARFDNKFAVYRFDERVDMPSLSRYQSNELGAVFRYVVAAISEDQAWGDYELRMIGDRYDGQTFYIGLTRKID